MGRSIALSWAVLGAQACASDDLFEIPPVVWSGEHLDYAPTEHAPPICAGTLPYMDRYMELAAAVTEVEIGRSVYVHGASDDRALCDAVHPLKFFEEGVAEMFGGDEDLSRRGSQ